jgi:signal transduction histidine kinase
LYCIHRNEDPEHKEEILPVNLQARLLKVRARVPMYRLFLKIFLWYWLTAWAMIAIVLLGSRLNAMKQVSSAPNMYATVAPIMAAEAAKAYESGGPEAFARFSRSNNHNYQRQLVLLDGSYKDVESRPVSEDGLRAAYAAKEGQLLVLRGRIAAYKFVSSSGHPYILMLFLKSNLRQIGEILWGGGFVFSISLVLLVTLLCLGLAYHIASPIRSIQSTARRVAQGDLKARVPTSVSRRFDELAALAKDFDSMVSRLDSLIETQKKLLNSVSHELRSPLARINISLALLRDRFSTDSEDLFQRLDRDVVRIDLLMGQLLTLSRLESGFSSGERELFAMLSLHTAGKRCADRFGRRSKRPRIAGSSFCTGSWPWSSGRFPPGDISAFLSRKRGRGSNGREWSRARYCIGSDSFAPRNNTRCEPST